MPDDTANGGVFVRELSGPAATRPAAARHREFSRGFSRRPPRRGKFPL